MIIMHEILGNPGTLCLPVKPYAHDAVMDMIAADGNIYARMQLASCAEVHTSWI